MPPLPPQPNLKKTLQSNLLAVIWLLNIQTDLGAAWSAAHIRPVLLVIHVIGKPGKTHTKKKALTSPPSHAVRMWVWGAARKCRSCAGAAFSARPFGSLAWVFDHTGTKCHQLNCTPSKWVQANPPVTLPSLWKLCVIIAKMMDVPPWDTTLSGGKWSVWCQQEQNSLAFSPGWGEV